jgi:hypothetical protein
MAAFLRSSPLVPRPHRRRLFLPLGAAASPDAGGGVGSAFGERTSFLPVRLYLTRRTPLSSWFMRLAHPAACQWASKPSAKRCWSCAGRGERAVELQAGEPLSGACRPGVRPPADAGPQRISRLAGPIGPGGAAPRPS